MLKLIEITKEYKTEEESVLALHNVSLEFRKNEFVSILGPSGCGKTTMLNIIGGLDRYTSGDIQVDGISTEEFDDVDWDTYRNRRIGFVFQSYNLIPHMTVLKNVQLSLTLAGISKEEGRERALEALRKVGLEKQAKKKPNQMSGGQMQRVAIARALVNNPDIILADEPTGALDSESGVQVMELLKEVAEDRLVIMVTHNGQLAEEYSTRIINLRDGEVSATQCLTTARRKRRKNPLRASERGKSPKTAMKHPFLRMKAPFLPNPRRRRRSRSLPGSALICANPARKTSLRCQSPRQSICPGRTCSARRGAPCLRPLRAASASSA